MPTRLLHASTPYPRGEQHEVRAVYGDVVGIDEKPVAEPVAELELIWFAAGDGDLELHFLPDPAGIDPQAQRHFCLEVDDLDGYRRRLTEAGFAPYDGPPIPNRPRFFCRDPFGNLLEFTRIEGDYLGGTPA